MRTLDNRKKIAFLLMTFASIAMAQAASAGEVQATYLYNLSDFDGVVTNSWARIAIDDSTGEVAIADTTSGTVQIYTSTGMQIYEFILSDFGFFTDFTMDREGHFLLMTRQRSNSPFSVAKLNYRGELISRVYITGLPEGFPTDYYPQALACKNGLMYFVEMSSMLILVTDMNGVVQRTYEIAKMSQFDEKNRRGNSGIFGFTVDSDGNMLFTVPSMFLVYVISPDGKIKTFGQRGGAPGKFNVIAGIATDDMGNIYVSDRLKCAIMVFDREFKFKTEFGYRGYDPGNLIVPDRLAVDNRSKRLYVSQAANRGVSVFSIEFN